MSYILEALKKADQERVVGKVPDLDSVHEQVRPVRRNTRWPWILAALLVINGMLVTAYLLYNRDAGDEPEPAAPAPVVKSAPPAAATAEPPRPAPPARPAIPPRPAVTTRPPAPRTQARPYVPPPARQAPAEKPAAVVTPKVAGTVTRAEEPLDAAPASAAPAPAPAAQPTRTPTAEPATGLPYWNDLSLEFRSGFKAPRIDVHVYDTNPELRFILVNLTKYREGDRLPSGAQLEKITPEGVQLLFKGKQFIYRQ